MKVLLHGMLLRCSVAESSFDAAAVDAVTVSAGAVGVVVLWVILQKVLFL